MYQNSNPSIGQDRNPGASDSRVYGFQLREEAFFLLCAINRRLLKERLGSHRIRLKRLLDLAGRRFERRVQL